MTLSFKSVVAGRVKSGKNTDADAAGAERYRLTWRCRHFARATLECLMATDDYFFGGENMLRRRELFAAARFTFLADGAHIIQ